MASDPESKNCGKFITFEGGEGTGKSTQVKALAQKLEEQGIDVVVTREPGGTPSAELIRDLLVTGAPDRWTPLSEALLNYAARHEHLKNLIRPALAQDQWVLSDRFVDSTLAYQGTAEGVGYDTIQTLYHLVVGSSGPNLTFILDLPVEEGLKRAEGRGAYENRYEKMGVAFHEHVRQSFLMVAKREPQRCVVIDGSQQVGDISARIWNEIAARWGNSFKGDGS